LHRESFFLIKKWWLILTARGETKIAVSALKTRDLYLYIICHSKRGIQLD